MTNQTLPDSILIAIAMIEKSQVLSTVQQIKLRRLELAIEALKEQIECQCNSQKPSAIDNNDCLVGANLSTKSYSTPL